jgi:benzoate-CoA ligase
MSTITLNLPEQYNVSEVLFHNLDAGRENRTAVVCGEESWTYGQLATQANRVGNALRGLGLQPGVRVMQLLLDTPVFPAAFFGAVRSGVVPIITNTMLPSGDYEYFLQDSEAEAVIVDAALYPKIAEIRGNCPGVRHVIVVGGEGGSETLDWTELVGAAEVELDSDATHRDDPAFWMYSSGTTGRPKGIVHLQHDIPYTVETYAKQVLGFGEDDLVFSAAKLFFAYGFGNGMTFPFSVGAKSVLMPGRPTPDAVFEQLEQHQPTLFFGVPTLYVAMLAQPNAKQRNLSSLRLCVSAAEALPREIFRQWQENYSVEIAEGCGSTEMLHIYVSNHPGRIKPGSTGQEIEGYDLKLADKSGNPVAQGEAGDMLVRGDSSAPYYWNKPEKTAQTMRGEWLFTGDRYWQDEDGYYFFAGRSDDMLKVSGQWVSPIEVEGCLIEHPAVLESGVVGITDETGLMRTKAFVVLAEGHKAQDALVTELQEFVKSRLAPHKYPRLVEFVPELPKTATGKIQRFKLRG